MNKSLFPYFVVLSVILAVTVTVSANAANNVDRGADAGRAANRSWKPEESAAAPAPPGVSTRVRVVSVDGKPASNYSWSYSIVGKDLKAEWSGSGWGPWIEGEAYKGSKVARFSTQLLPVPSATPFPRLRLEVETHLQGIEFSSSEAELFGPNLGVVVWIDEQGSAHIDTEGGHSRRTYLPAFQKAAIPLSARPKKIVFGDRFIVDNTDQDLVKRRIGIRGLAGLGINALASQGSAFPGERTEFYDVGIKNVWEAVSSPPGYNLNFDPNRQKLFQDFVQQNISPLLAAGWKKSEIAFYNTSDEPGWYYPDGYRKLNGDPNALASFHAYLQKNGLEPDELGCKSWSEVRLTGRREYHDLAGRRLFYWSNRFVPYASARFFAEVTREYEQLVRPGFPVLINFNNFLGRFYQPGPIANNGDTTSPNAAMGQHDWLEFGRLRGATAPSTEDWFDDRQASQWSFYASRLRSAARLSGDPKMSFGALIIPRVSGNMPGGMTLKILGLVGNGAKCIELFTFGPEYAFPGTCWSENTKVYPEISRGTALVAKAEDLLYPGRPRRSPIAILAPQSSQLWDLEQSDKPLLLQDATNTSMTAARMEYEAETYAVFQALQHQAIPVDWIDEYGLNAKELKKYKVLYVTAPDVPVEAQAALLGWVRDGGTLVTCPGAAMFDRYHQPVSVIQEACGYTASSVRNVLQWPAHTMGTVHTSGNHGELPVANTREILTFASTKKPTEVIYRFLDGKPALLMAKLERGAIYHYAFYPGLSHLMVTESTGQPKLRESEAAWRSCVALPVRLAGVSLPVKISQPLVEAPVLYSDKGVAVTLLNWGEVKEQELNLTVQVDRPVRAAYSARYGPIQFTQSKLTFNCRTKLSDADVLKLYY